MNWLITYGFTDKVVHRNNCFENINLKMTNVVFVHVNTKKKVLVPVVLTCSPVFAWTPSPGLPFVAAKACAHPAASPAAVVAPPAAGYACSGPSPELLAPCTLLPQPRQEINIPDSSLSCCNSSSCWLCLYRSSLELLAPCTLLPQPRQWIITPDSSSSCRSPPPRPQLLVVLVADPAQGCLLLALCCLT